MKISEIRSLLLDRGTALNPGYAGDVTEAIYRATGFNPTQMIVDLFNCFDGFPSGVVDAGSGIRIWPLSDVLKSSAITLSPRMAFGDFLMDSEDLSFDVTDDGQPILYDRTCEQVAAGVSDFFSRLALGRLDFL